jgi:hypothetical protein
MDTNRLNNIFTHVKEQIIHRLDSLNSLNVLSNKISFEGWLKVEAIKAINQQINSTQNRGSDLKLTDGSKIELKASMDLLHKGYFFHRKRVKYSDPVLLIAGGDIKRLNQFASKYNLDVLQSHELNDFLVMALVKP